MNTMNFFKFNSGEYVNTLRGVETMKLNGRITQIIGLVIEAHGPSVSLGHLCYIRPKGAQEDFIPAEVVGFREKPGAVDADRRNGRHRAGL